MTAEQAPTFFISDLHLEASRHSITEAFKYFLSDIAHGAKAIYILGDFFDTWIGDDDNSHYVQSIKTLLASTISAGTQVYFVHGNRDFLIGKRFESDTGVILLNENTVIDLYGEKVLLLHGDTLCTDDLAYQDFRKKVRDPSWQKKMLGYPLFIRRIIAGYLRYRSRKANSNKAENIMDVSVDTVLKTFDHFNIQKMIHGHTHRPNRHTIEANQKSCERIVLGDWEAYGWYLRADTHGQELVKFSTQFSRQSPTQQKKIPDTYKIPE